MLSPELNTEVLDQVQFHLAQGDFDKALAVLNLMSDYRFTALYHIAGDRLNNLLVFDREAGRAARLEPTPLGDSYCEFVNHLRDAFIVEDSNADARVADHPKRPVVQAYCGVPLVGMAGQVFGTLCHFDYRPVEEDGTPLKWLRAAAHLFDPRRLSETRARGIAPRVDALDAMSRLLEGSLLDSAEACAAFEEYARPVRDHAQGLPDAVLADTNTRIDAILQRMTGAIEARAGVGRAPLTR